MLRGWFESTFGESALAAQFVVALVIVVLVLAIVAWLFGKRSKRDAIRGPARGRQPRLSVMEAARVDSRRRLVLVRRDHVEHLVLVGGPSDIVVEPNIIRGRPASSAIAKGKQVAAQRAQAHQAQLQQIHAQQSPGQQTPVRQAPVRQGPRQQTPAQQQPVPHADNHQAPYAAPDRGPPETASPSAAAMAAAVLAGTDEPAEQTEQNGRAHLIPSSPRSEPPATQTTEAGRATERAHPDEADQAPEIRQQDQAGERLQQSIDTSVTQFPADEQRSGGDDGGPAGSTEVASLAAGAAALTAAAGSRSAGNVAERSEAEPAGQPETNERPTDTGPYGQASGAEHAADSGIDPSRPAARSQEFGRENGKAKEAAEAASEVRTSAEDAVLEAELRSDLPDDEAFPEIGAEPVEEIDDSPSEPGQPWHDTTEDTDRLEDRLPETVAEAGDEDVPAETDDARPVDFRKTDPYADVEHEFRKAFETSLRGLKAKVHSELAPTAADRPAAQATIDDTSPAAADDAAAGSSGINVAHSAETELLQSVSSVDKDVEPSSAPENAGDQDASRIPSADADRDSVERLESGLPAELAFLDTPPGEMSVDQPDDSDIELSESDEDPAFNASLPDDEVEDVAEMDIKDPSPEVVVRNPVLDGGPAPSPRTSPFPTIPESVRKSVMAAASRAIAPELAAGLEQGGDKDVATTTLGDLAKRLEKALSEQSEASGSEPVSEAGDPSDLLVGLASIQANDDDYEDDEGDTAPIGYTGNTEGDDGAVIDFNALRRDSGEASLEDEMAKLLNDLTGDTNKAG